MDAFEMRFPIDSASVVLRHPVKFHIRVLKAFRANQGFLLAGAVAYYTLLSLIPLTITILIVLSHVVDRAELLTALRRYLELVAPGQSMAIVEQLESFLSHRAVIGPVLAATLLFFSSLAFTVLENAMSVIFTHRVLIRRRHFLISALIPYCYILSLGVGFLVITVVSGMLQALGAEKLEVLGHEWSLLGLSGALLYLVGVAGEVLILTSIYMVMPVGRLSLRHALLGGVSAALLWEITRHALVWYFGTISQVQVVYGSLTTAIIVLFSLEIAAIVLLVGAQVIAEFERVTKENLDAPPKPLETAES